MDEQPAPAVIAADHARYIMREATRGRTPSRAGSALPPTCSWPSLHVNLAQEYLVLEAERDRLMAKVREYEAWADRIAHDERVVGWVHQEDYSLYSLLADPEIALESKT